MISERVDDLISACANYICGPVFLMYENHDKEKNLELCYPVTHQVNGSSFETKIIGRCEVYFMFQFGTHDMLDKAVLSLLESLDETIDTNEAIIREIYHEYYPENQSENVTEIQLLIPLENE